MHGCQLMQNSPQAGLMARAWAEQGAGAGVLQFGMVHATKLLTVFSGSACALYLEAGAC